MLSHNTSRVDICVWEITPDHICCYLGTTLLAQFIVCLLVIPPTVLYVALPTDSLVIGRQMGPHTYAMLGAASLWMLCGGMNNETHSAHEGALQTYATAYRTMVTKRQRFHNSKVGH